MLRPLNRANVGLSFACGIALLLCALPWPIAIPQTPSARGNPDCHSRKFDLAPARLDPVFASATAGETLVDPYCSELLEEVEDESFYSIVDLVLPTLITPDEPVKAPSDLHAISSTGTIVVLPLRC